MANARVFVLADPWQAFKSYDEAGNSRRVQCLKYMVLANMLMESKVDPFDAQEAKPYKQDPEVRVVVVEAGVQTDGRLAACRVTQGRLSAAGHSLQVTGACVTH
jgi:hypothetical protein